MLNDLIELAENEVPITMSSLINTIFKTSDNVLKRIKNGNVFYAGNTKMNYKFCIMDFSLDMGKYILFVINYNSKKEEKVVKIDDQVIIIKIKALNEEKITNNGIDHNKIYHTDIYTNHKYTD